MSATGYTISAPIGSPQNHPSGQFLITAVGGTFNGSQTVTVSDNGANGIFIGPSSSAQGSLTITPANASSSAPFWYIPTLSVGQGLVGFVTMSFTNNSSWSDAANYSYAVKYLYPIHDTDFTAQGTVAAVGAGATLVDGWIDEQGGATVSSSGLQMSTGVTDPIIRPSAENVRHNRIKKVVTIASGAAFGVVTRYQSAGNYYFCFAYGASIFMRKVVGGGVTNLSFTSYGTNPGPVVGHTYTEIGQAISTDATHTTIVYTIWDNASPSSVYINIAVDTTAQFQATGSVGFSGFTPVTGDLVLHASSYDDFDVNDLYIGTLTSTQVNANSYPTGGGASYGAALTHQWEKIDDPNTTTTSTLTGQTGQHLVSYTPPDTKLHWYADTVSDGVVTKVTGLLGLQGYGYVWPAAAVPDPVIPTLPANALKLTQTILCCGDSLSGGLYPSRLQTVLQTAAAGGVTISVQGTGHPGTRVSDWLPTAPATGSGQSVLDGTKNNINAALAYAAANSVKYVTLRLGTNNAIGNLDIPTSITDLGTVCNAFVSAGLKVILQSIPAKIAQLGTGSTVAYVETFNTQLATLINGSTILAGTTLVEKYGLNHFTTVYTSGGAADLTHWIGDTGQMEGFDAGPIVSAMTYSPATGGGAVNPAMLDLMCGGGLGIMGR